jgi:hypothetical protein
LALALAILLNALVLQCFRSDQVADKLLARADGLIPRALRAVRVVLRDGAGAAQREGTGFDCGFRGIVLGGGIGLLGLTLGLRKVLVSDVCY